MPFLTRLFAFTRSRLPRKRGKYNPACGHFRLSRPRAEAKKRASRTTASYVLGINFQKTFLNACGLSTVDMHLIQAECKLRDGDITGAMEILNGPRAKRVEPYAPITATTAAEVFAVLAVYYGGHKMRARQAHPTSGAGGTLIPDYFLNAWTPENTDTNVPGIGRYSATSIGGESTYTDIYVHPADFIKIRNIVLGYDIPETLLARVGLKTPKGKNLLGTVTDLDQLLNYQYTSGDVPDTRQISALVNDTHPGIETVDNLVNNPVKTLNSALFTWDEEVDREALTLADPTYMVLYLIIGKVANPVLLMADAAEGDRDLANRLKAEAYVLRAYFHYLLVNIYAKAYDPATAATDGGIPYARETDLLSVPNHKYTVKEVYDFILADLKAAHDLNALPDEPVNPMRVGKVFAYAVEAKARMSMRDFPGAATAAANALAIRNTVDDHRDNVVAGNSMLGVPGNYFTRPEILSQEDYFYASGTYLLYNGLTPELGAAFEPGHIFYNSVEKFNAYALMFHGVECDLLFSQGTYLNACGLSTVDMLLVQAECKLRDNDVAGAMAILNDLRAKRVDPYTPINAATAAEAFAVLKNVSRTEGWLGPRNFINLKRWNTEEAYKETLTKTLLGNTYTLPPDSPLWIFPFPQNATGLNPNLTQNY